MPNLKKIKYIISSVVLLVLSVNFARTTLDVMKNSRRLERLRVEVNRLEEDKREISEELEYQKTSEYVERQARDKLNMIKPGEHVLLLKRV